MLERRIRSLSRRTAIAIAAGGVTGCIGYGIPTPVLVPRPEQVTWGGLGIGVGSAGFMAQGDLTRVTGGRLLRARWNVEGDGGNWSGQTPRQVSEFSVLVGRGRVCCWGTQWGGYAIGGGLLSGSKGSPAKGFTTVGVAGELMLVTGKLPHIAPSVIANLNPEMPFLEVNIAILIGRMPFFSTAPPRRRY